MFKAGASQQATSHRTVVSAKGQTNARMAWYRVPGVLGTPSLEEAFSLICSPVLAAAGAHQLHTPETG